MTGYLAQQIAPPTPDILVALEDRSFDVEVLVGLGIGESKSSAGALAVPFFDGEKIEKVHRLFHAKTDTEAIHKALEKTIEDREIEEALDALLRAGRFRTVYR